MTNLNNFFNQNPIFENEKKFAIAVSGGADSLVLLYLFHKWAKPNKKTICAITFDHNLRHNSKDDSILVKKYCSSLKLKHIILRWRHRPETAILEKARIARYDAITKYCRSKKIKTLLLGHHADDIAETIAIRLLRKTNLDGLCPLYAQRELFNIKLVRPLLNFTKEEIYKLARKARITFFEDPSNQNDKFLRVKLRKYFYYNKKLKDDLIRISRVFCKFRLITERLVKENMHSFMKCEDEGYIKIDKKLLLKFPEFLSRKFLALSIMGVGNTFYPPSTNFFEKLFIKLKSEEITNITVAGSIIMIRKKRILIAREFNKINSNEKILLRNKKILWDNRFLITNLSKTKDFTVSSLNNQMMDKKFVIFSDKKKKKERNIHYFIKKGLPVIKSLEGFTSIPHLNIYNEIINQSDISIKVIDFHSDLNKSNKLLWR